MIDNLFEMKYLQFSVKDWVVKKKKLVELFKNVPDTRNGIQCFLTNRQSDTENLRQPFVDILKDEFNEISQFIKKDIKLAKLWSVSYEKNDYHLVHNHGHRGFSGILYLDYVEGHPPTSYVQPWADPYSDMTKYRLTGIKEGDITVVPSLVHHFSQSNPKDETKRIIAFDLEFFNE